ncbi:Pls/PosA family non-ribosomal peptide synthetase [Rhodococcus sp. X156]|uniref:Pls/PosA family non-ribosomal peptide synthetase n=1 Tax=Rhodococcus sp. X156 TaxID=2499145 RepID=UPI001F49D0B1|nr:Pls/PosA family non-ribosomal peptide synthetase [Rhodococcus sp. X156]
MPGQTLPGQKLPGSAAPEPRTLLDILAATAASWPDADALDDGHRRLGYADLWLEVRALAAVLAGAGIGPGDRVGVRIPSGSCELYVAILGVLAAGAAYVPVDADDPEERATLVFGEAEVRLVLDGKPLEVVPATPRAPTADDDAWIIFTSGSTGVPKGVAVSHRSAAAFVDAEARLFLPDHPVGPGDRVLAGLSVGFDASCEEMWLAWRHGACLVPAPRSLVRSGSDLGPWLVAHDITVVSTVPTLAALWPAEALEAVRLLIFGGEPCPPELVARLTVPGREVWNTYGPTEATVVACAARLTGEGPVRIGQALDGWELAVVDATGARLGEGEIGELIIGGVGLARYLDPAKDAEKFAPLPALGWDRAYRSGDLVRNDAAGLVFVGRADDQVKMGGRRIELGEVDAALQALPDVAAAAAAVRTTPAGHPVLVGYLAPSRPDFDVAAARVQLGAVLPAALVPMLAVVPALPTRSSGKVDRAALPWPLPVESAHAEPQELTGTLAWVAEQWTAVLGAPVHSPDADFFAAGGGSLAAAQLVSALRQRYPAVTVADVYDYPRISALAAALEELAAPPVTVGRTVVPTPRRTQVLQLLLAIPLQTVVGLRWLTCLAALNNVLGPRSWAPAVSWWWVVLGVVVLVSPPGRMAIAVAGARILLRGVRPGEHPRGGSVHLRLWLAERLADASGAVGLAGSSWVTVYARALGARVGKNVHLHSLPPVTGMLTLERGCSVEPEVDLAGHWVDGDVLHLGRIHVGPGATVGTRSTLLPGARIGADAEIAAGSAVTGTVPAEQRWAGSPATPMGRAKHPWPERAPARSRVWVLAYGVGSLLLAALPVLAGLPGIALLAWAIGDAPSLGAATGRGLLALPGATLLWLLGYALLTGVLVRALGVGMRAGTVAVHSRRGWQVWASIRLMDAARGWLFPLYSSLLTPVWLRALGARVGRGVEASTVLLLPRMTVVRDGAFLADDTLVAGYRLGGGWLRIAEAKVGKRAFLGNSGVTAGGRSVPKNGLVAVLSAAPAKAKAGSSWLGNPPVRLRRAATGGDEGRTFAPSRRVRVARALVELLRVVPVIATAALGLGVLATLQLLLARFGGAVAAACAGLVLIAAGAVAVLATSAAKWLLVGRFRPVEHPLWSSFVWRNEVADTFVEVLAAPWFARAATGTPVLGAWLRTMGARIGRGVWCESYWLPEADLVTLGDGATVNRGCVVQTHLFHDRVMSMDTVTLHAGATLGPHSVVLPAAVIGANTTVGPASLVMRGDEVPAGTRWVGNPIAVATTCR